MTERSHEYYMERARHATRSQYSEHIGRASQPMTAGWRKYHPERVLIVEGDNYFTDIQYRLKQFVLTHEGERFTMSEMAESLGCAVSTVSRALTRLAALRLIAFDVVRGRNGGVTFLSIAWADLKARSRNAWAKIRDERRKVWQRYVEKLDKSHYFWAGLNVASLEVKDATLT